VLKADLYLKQPQTLTGILFFLLTHLYPLFPPPAIMLFSYIFSPFISFSPINFLRYRPLCASKGWGLTHETSQVLEAPYNPVLFSIYIPYQLFACSAGTSSHSSSVSFITYIPPVF